MNKAIAELTQHQTEMVLISNSHVSMDMLACMQDSIQTVHTEYRDSVKMFQITKELGALQFNDRSVVG